MTILVKEFRIYKEQSKSYIITSIKLLLSSDKENKNNYPETAYSETTKGDIFLDKSEYDKAIKHYDHALQIDNKYADAWNAKGIAFMYLGKYDEAIKCYEKIIKDIDKQSISAWFNKGLAFINLGKYDEAIECYEKIIKDIDKQNVDALCNKGIVLGMLGRCDEAIIEFDKALEKSDFIHGLNLKGECLNSLNKFKEAIYCFDKVLNMSNDNIRALLNKAIAFYYLKENDKSIEYYDKALKINTNISEALIGKAIILYDKDDKEKYSEAISFCQKVIRNPNSHLESNTSVINKAYLIKGQCEYQLDNYSDALKDLDKVDDKKLFAQKSVTKGLCYFKLGLFEEAEKELRNAITYNSKLVEAYYNLAVIYTQENKNQEAIKLLEKCIKINKKFSYAKEALIRLKISEQSDWYDWWFGVRRIKKALGIVLIASIFWLC